MRSSDENCMRQSINYHSGVVGGWELAHTRIITFDSYANKSLSAHADPRAHTHAHAKAHARPPAHSKTSPTAPTVIN